MPSFRPLQVVKGFEPPYVPALAATEPRLLFWHGPRISAGVPGIVRGVGIESEKR